MQFWERSYQCSDNLCLFYISIIVWALIPNKGQRGRGGSQAMCMSSVHIQSLSLFMRGLHPKSKLSLRLSNKKVNKIMDYLNHN